MIEKYLTHEDDVEEGTPSTPKHLHQDARDRHAPKWLRSVQDHSWEPELLVSGGAIFTLLQVPEVINRYALLTEQQTGYTESVTIAFYVLVAVNGLIAGFVLHLILRGLWVSMVCLSYVFPMGIRKDRLPDNAPEFKNHFSKMKGVVDLVIQLEKACSLVFSYSFMFLLNVLGLLLVLFILIPHQGLKEQVPYWAYMTISLASAFALVMGLLYLIDFLTFGWVKRQKWLAPVYKPIYTIFSILSLGFLFRRAYYAYSTNAPKWALLLTIFGGIVVALAITLTTTSSLPGSVSAFDEEQSEQRKYLQVSRKNWYADELSYDQLRKDDQLIDFASIPARVLDGPIELFIVHHKIFETYMDNACPSTQGDPLACLATFFKISIDGQLVQEPLSFIATKHSTTGESGFFTVLQQPLEPGRHVLKIELPQRAAKLLYPEYDRKYGHWANIPFFKVPEN